MGTARDGPVFSKKRKKGGNDQRNQGKRGKAAFFGPKREVFFLGGRAEGKGVQTLKGRG